MNVIINPGTNPVSLRIQETTEEHSSKLTPCTFFQFFLLQNKNRLVGLVYHRCSVVVFFAVGFDIIRKLIRAIIIVSCWVHWNLGQVCPMMAAFFGCCHICDGQQNQWVAVGFCCWLLSILVAL
jgi:hypothetical protein